MKKRLLFVWLIPLLLSSGCSKSPSRDLPPTLMWDKDQDLIHPSDGTLNAWEGFTVTGDHFAANRDIAQFILWRRHKGKVDIFFEYSLQGNKIDFTVNFRQRKTLMPSPAFKRGQFSFHLNPGFNFLKFTKKKKDILKIRAVSVGAWREKPQPHLRSGESLRSFYPAGRGRLELSGRGTVEIVREQAAGEDLAATSEKLHSRFFSRKISRDLDFSGPGALTVKVKTGSFNVRSYSYVLAPAIAADPGTTFNNKPNIYIVLSDACQASHLGTYGYRRNTSPHIDAFARDAVVYENAYTNAVFTLASVSTILSGIYPDSHGVNSLLFTLPRKLLTLPEFLKSQGYATSIITSTFGVSARFGFTQGVDAFLHVPEKNWAPKAASIFSELSGWLKKTPPPHFSYMHFIHPHLPKVPPPDFPVYFREKRSTLERIAQLQKKKKQTGVPLTAEELQEIVDGYDSSIAWVDGEFGKMLELLRIKNLYDESLIIFLADHGEALGEHGVLSHSNNVYDETTRVPLIVKYPKSLGIKGRVPRLVELADIFPTISSLFGQRLVLDGRNLLGEGAVDDRPVVSRSVNKSPKYALRWKDWYYMINFGDNSDQLFLLSADPLHEAAGVQSEEMRAFLKARFFSWYGRFRNGSGSVAEVSLKNLPVSVIEEMKTLGYL